MADEEDLLGSMDELGDEEGEEEEGGEASPLMRYLPVIGAVLVVQIIIGYAIGSLFFGGSEEPMAEGGETVVAQADAPLQEEVVWEGLDPIVVNPAGTGGLRFANVHIHLGLSSQPVYEVIETNKLASRIRDRLITVLSERTIDQLDPRHHGDIKNHMKEVLNEFLSPNSPPDAVKQVYFQSFVLQ